MINSISICFFFLISFRFLKKVNIEKQFLVRFIVMGKKSLPDPSKKSQPFWGFVEMVTTNVEDVKTVLKGGKNIVSLLKYLVDFCDFDFFYRGV